MEELIIQPTKNSQLSWYVRNKAKLNRYNADRRWHCTVCDFECAAAYKTTHLKTAKHKAAVAVKEGGAPPTWCNTHKQYCAADFEICEVCHISILKKSMCNHLKTKAHLKNAEKAEKGEKGEKAEEAGPEILD